MNKKNFLITTLLAITLTSCLKQKDDYWFDDEGDSVSRTFDWAGIADTVQNGLNTYFWHASNHYFTMQMNGSAFNHNYWPNAHALDVLLDKYIRADKDEDIKDQMDDLIAGLKTANGNSYINTYYDDMQWLLISSLRAYEETNDNRYLDVCTVVWDDVKGGWDNVTGGGFYWRKDRANKNTPANAPACIFAARAYQITGNNEYLAWANNIYNWLKEHMIRSNGDVWDGTSSFAPLAYDTRLYTYNYGIVIGSALELYKITKNAGFKNDAIKVATAALAKLARNGVLVSGDTGDGGLFNGIFVRYLVRLIVEGDIDTASKKMFIDFLRKNGETMWQKGAYLPAGLIGPDWQSVTATTTLTPQLSGAMLAEGLAELERRNLLD